MRRKRWRDAPGRADAHYSLEKSYLLPDEVLKHRALPRTLSPDHGDLGQVQIGVLTDGRESILHAVHQRNQILHSPVAHLGDAPSCLSSSSKRGRVYFSAITSTLAFTEGVVGLFRADWSVLSFIDCQITSERTGPLLHRAPQGGRKRMSSQFPTLTAWWRHSRKYIATALSSERYLYICPFSPLITFIDSNLVV